MVDRNHLLPESSLEGKAIIVTGGARGLGLTQAEALVDAGAIVHALDILPTPSPDFERISAHAKTLGTSITYHITDVRSSLSLSNTVSRIGAIDGLIAAAAVHQETPALSYKAVDSNALLEVHVTGVLLTAQTVARQMIACGTGGSIVLVSNI